MLKDVEAHGVFKCAVPEGQRFSRCLHKVVVLNFRLTQINTNVTWERGWSEAVFAFVDGCEFGLRLKHVQHFQRAKSDGAQEIGYGDNPAFYTLVRRLALQADLPARMESTERVPSPVSPVPTKPRVMRPEGGTWPAAPSTAEGTRVGATTNTEVEVRLRLRKLRREVLLSWVGVMIDPDVIELCGAGPRCIAGHDLAIVKT